MCIMYSSMYCVLRIRVLVTVRIFTCVSVLTHHQPTNTQGELLDYPNWKDDAERAEKIYLELPSELESWFQRMQIMLLSKQAKFDKVVEKSEELFANSIIAVPPQTWQTTAANDNPHKEPTEEEQIFFRLGFIFIAYRVDFWWCEHFLIHVHITLCHEELECVQIEYNLGKLPRFCVENRISLALILTTKEAFYV